MKKAINLYISKIDTLDKINYIKEAGFEGIYTGMYNKPENMELDDIIAKFKELGFVVPQMHCSYIEPKLKDIWQEGESGDEQIQSLLNQIDQTAKYGIKNFVIHTNGEFNPPISKIGLERIEKLLKRSNQYDINLCIENLYDFNQMKFIFDNIENKNLKVCYDCGHNNCLNPNDAVFETFKDKITVLHLHDNHGKPLQGIGDEHLMLGEGNMNLESLAQNLAKLPEDVVLCAEYKLSEDKCNKNSFIKAKSSLDYLDSLIEKYRNNEKNN